MTDRTALSRRTVLATAAAGTGLGLMGKIAPVSAQAATGAVIQRPIPSTGEMLPIVGIGTAVIYDFDHVAEKDKYAERLAVIRTLTAPGGGKLIDTAPSYGKAETVLGSLMADTGTRDKIFLATKVAVRNREDTIAEMRQGLQRLRTDKVDLMQLHNVRDPNQSLALLREWKQQGICRYVGLTSSFDRDYDAVAATLAREKPDFFQINYSLHDRDAEDKLLPLAKDSGCAVLTNLPFGRNSLFRKVAGKTVPEWGKEFDATSWAQFFLKFLLSHPAVTAVIPGTDKPEYMVDNLGAGRGRMPDAAMRQRMIAYIDSLA